MADPTVRELLALLEPEERSAIAAGLNKPWMPTPGPQIAAYVSPAEVTGFGGAAGGGKSALACGLAVTEHRNIAIFRQNGTELQGITDEIARILGSRDGYNGQDRIWRFTRYDGLPAQIEFGSFPAPGDAEKYRGRPHDLLVFDEAQGMREADVRFLMGWLRTTGDNPGQRCRALLTFNPPSTVEGRWLLRYFGPWIDKKHPNPAAPGELRWFAMLAGKEIEVASGAPFDHEGERVIPQSRTFIPSRLDDNPYLRDTGYRATVMAMPEPLRSQMLYGDFSAGTEDDAMQVIPTAWVEAAMARWKPRNPMPEMDSIGVDVAMGGKDNTIIARRHAHWFDVPIVYEGHRCPDGPTVAGYIISAQRERAPIHIDLFGVGAEPYGHLMKMQAPVLGISMNEKTAEIAIEGRRRFFNVRSLLWWRMREALNPTNPLQIDLPNDRRLLADLCAPKWEERAGGIIYVQGREEIVDTIGRSPDFGTAYILALMHNPVLRGQGAGWEQKNKPYDPLDGMDEWRRNWRDK